MQITAEAKTAIYCEGCGEDGKTYEDPQYPGEGYMVDLCRRCLADKRREVKFWANQERLANMTDAQAKAAGLL